MESRTLTPTFLNLKLMILMKLMKLMILMILKNTYLFFSGSVGWRVRKDKGLGGSWHQKGTAFRASVTAGLSETIHELPPWQDCYDKQVGFYGCGGRECQVGREIFA